MGIFFEIMNYDYILFAIFSISKQLLSNTNIVAAIEFVSIQPCQGI